MNFLSVSLQNFIGWSSIATINACVFFKYFGLVNSLNDMLPSQISKAQMFLEGSKISKNSPTLFTAKKNCGKCLFLNLLIVQRPLVLYLPCSNLAIAELTVYNSSFLKSLDMHFQVFFGLKTAFTINSFVSTMICLNMYFQVMI